MRLPVQNCLDKMCPRVRMQNLVTASRPSDVAKTSRPPSCSLLLLIATFQATLQASCATDSLSLSDLTVLTMGFKAFPFKTTHMRSFSLCSTPPAHAS